MPARLPHAPPLVALLARRAAAYMIDVAVIMAYALLLAAVTFLLWRPESSIGGGNIAQAVAGQVIGLLTLTLPVVLAFAWLESARGPWGWAATPGKRLFGLRVCDERGEAPSFGQSLLRNAIKFLPWELAHTGVHHAIVEAHPLPWLGIGMSLVGQLAWLTLALSCAVGHGRGWHDRAARVLIRRDGTEMSGGSKGHVRAETR